MVTDDMVSAARAAYSKATGCDDTPHVLEGWIDDALRAALEAALSAQDTGAIAVTDEMVGQAAGTYWREHWGVFGNAQKDAIRRNMRAALEVALEPQERDGWKLVPVVPSKTMINAGHETYCRETLATEWVARAVWAAMLAAAPPHTEGK